MSRAGGIEAKQDPVLVRDPNKGVLKGRCYLRKLRPNAINADDYCRFASESGSAVPMKI